MSTYTERTNSRYTMNDKDLEKLAKQIKKAADKEGVEPMAFAMAARYK